MARIGCHHCSHFTPFTNGHALPSTFIRRGDEPIFGLGARYAREKHYWLINSNSSGKPYETTIMIWPMGDGFVIALTSGPEVDWSQYSGCWTLYAALASVEYLKKPTNLDFATK